MWGIPAALLGASILFGGTPQATIAPADFQRWFDESASGLLRIPDEVEQRAQRFRYVFVGGFQNEFKPGYFAQNIKELKALGVSRKAIHEIYPSSRKTIDESRDEVRDQFLEIAGAGPEKLVVIAHSRGACDALAFALENPDFTRDRVAFLFLVQGPLGGSPLADYVLGDGKPMDHSMRMRHRVMFFLSGKVERVLWKRGIHAGLPALGQSTSERFWDRLREGQADSAAIVGPKTFYVTSRIDPTELGFVKGSSAR